MRDTFYSQQGIRPEFSGLLTHSFFLDAGRLQVPTSFLSIRSGIQCLVNQFLTRINVLVLEDDPNDAFLIRGAFKNSGCDAFVCRNTSEAAAYLLGSGMYYDSMRYPLPNIVIYDIRLGQDYRIHFL